MSWPGDWGLSLAAIRTSTSPTSARISSSGTPPGRSNTGFDSARERTVDSTPTGQGPRPKPGPPFPQGLTHMRRGRGTHLAEKVGARRRDGPAGFEDERQGHDMPGNRMATVGRDDVTMSGTLGDLGRTSVKGPGQNFAMSFKAAEGIFFTRGSACRASATCTINGSNEGRFFTSKMRATARDSARPRPGRKRSRWERHQAAFLDDFRRLLNIRQNKPHFHREDAKSRKNSISHR